MSGERVEIGVESAIIRVTTSFGEVPSTMDGVEQFLHTGHFCSFQGYILRFDIKNKYVNCWNKMKRTNILKDLMNKIKQNKSEIDYLKKKNMSAKK